VATCAAVIALLSLVVTIVQVRAIRTHNRKFARPALQMGVTFHRGEPAGLLVSNVGLGPVSIVSSRLQVDDSVLGEFGEDTINQVRTGLAQRLQHRRVAAVQRHTTTLFGVRRYARSAFTQP
jgi:hypothetical protein